ncbi:beta-glucosidase BglX [Chryseotalea sanaruensis]|uniref:Periplasmic beta-glucosidase n=1 Tax=Chryseotalea sanaruensis TaxID=2482724 RepID=A0A401U643_9BACT|nr:beta-glucosidase BglX [Chryseotalea sanaruensis]GCC50266.1 beta-glucosidase BglX [Chryseotalea sanaruensis]
MITRYSSALILVFFFLACNTEEKSSSSVNKKVDSLINVMTIEEKVGQLNFPVGDLFNTGPTVRTAESTRFNELIKEGKITGLFNVHGATYTARLQKIAVEESRLGIPLLFGADVIHGFKTVFPLPLAEAASWDTEAIELAARVAAIEATAAGINFNFAPMVDIARDARWGRVSEGAGEDPYLGSLIAAARVRGFQGANLSNANTLAACVKHFAAYGAPMGGRDYNTVDMSLQTLHETYLPPYRAAVEAGSATIMTSFNELNGIPATAHTYLLEEVLRKQWGFSGMVVSDWQSIGEMLDHGFVADSLEAAKKAMEAGTDMDMMADIYLKKIPVLIANGQLDQKVLNQAVRRVLELKFKLGLFDNPYLYSDTVREQNEIRSVSNLAAAHEVAKKSIVLLKNENNILPLAKDVKRLAVIGPLANNKEDMNGSWSFFGEAQHPVSILEGIKGKVSSSTKISFAEGCNLYDNDQSKFADAIRIAKESDVVVMVLGESAVMNGEGASRADITLPGVQQQLLEAIHKTNKPIVVLLLNGRPLALEWMDKNIEGIVETWTLGSQAGLAVADVVFGDYNPAGKLPITFPRAVGQLPLYYNHKNTGRPYLGKHEEPLTERVYRSRYRDVPNTPLYPFGFGLSYSTFEYSNLSLSKKSLLDNETVSISVTVKNTSARDGEEVIQLYIRDLVASTTRPVKELKGFQKVLIKADEEKVITFTIGKDQLSFVNEALQTVTEPGRFQVMVGGNSAATLNDFFELK